MTTAAPPPTLAVHAGAGEWTRDEAAALEACSRALAAGWRLLDEGGSSLDAVITAVRVLEDDPACNAGTGAVLNSEGRLQLDASVMDGSTLASGAVGALPAFRHPVDVAMAVLEDGRYHLLVGEDAGRFAEERGFSPAEPDDMITAARRGELAVRRGIAGNTVGAVACDRRGGLASATSTGGITGTIPGRIGDTPIVGAGTYADGIGACSCTGDGEAFARACAAFDAVRRATSGAQSAVESSLVRVQEIFGGTGGAILVDSCGEIGVACTATKMPYGVAVGGKPFSLGT